MTVDFECKCGKALRAESKFAGRLVKCPQCGENVQVPQVAGGDPLAPAPVAVQAPAPAEPQVCGLAKGSLICGIIGIFCAQFVLGVIAIVLGVMARKKIARTPGLLGESKATAGIVLGVIDIIIGIIANVVTLMYLPQIMRALQEMQNGGY
jgi:hypothetical protein